jgi:hypothetical protein
MTTTLAARAPHAWLADGELRILAFGRLAVGTGEGGPDQATVNGTIVLNRTGRGRLFFRRRRLGRGFHSVEALWHLC